MEKLIPPQIEQSLRKWSAESGIIQALYTCLAIIAIVSSVSIPTLIGQVDISIVRGLGFLSALSIGILNGFDLRTKGNEIRAAFVRLRSLVVRYQHVDSYTIDMLINDYADLSSNISDIRADNSMFR